MPPPMMAKLPSILQQNGGENQYSAHCSTLGLIFLSKYQLIPPFRLWKRKKTPVTALQLAKKNPFGSLWFDDEGHLRPKTQRTGRESAVTVFEDMGSDVSVSDAGESATLVGSENQFNEKQLGEKHYVAA